MAKRTVIIKLPFPDKDLFPNRRNGNHWGKTVRVKDKQKSDAFYLTKAAAIDYQPAEGDIPISLLFLTPDGRHRDADNMLAASKALLDGVADALKVNDTRFRPILVDWARGPDKTGSLIAAVGVAITSAIDVF